ncbi:protein translocase subunit SecD [Effusibacillus lacus]|uniref:Protein translocase subunit SecD n=1 Tax=Effusibacillus lacus TaxID=1348429 RepID=A0A292YEE3_9BACL|nr:protein translocase subunit SecD [Effusibacillus lacus]TCS68971.1 SecD/SecF fusion protein [Effusibacillus lacus]GAX91462.1 protein translocase subunit SecD [Effusibacillus lacus]
MKWSKLITLLLVLALFSGLAGTTTKRLWDGIPLGLDLQGGFDVLYEVQPAEKEQVTREGVLATMHALENRANALGAKEPNITIEGTNRIRVQLAGVANQDEAKRILGEPAKLEFRSPDDKEVLLTGADLKANARFQQDPQTGQIQVAVEFKDPKRLQEVTTKYLGQPMGIWLNGEQLSKPVIQSVLVDGKAVITGMGGPKEANELATLLNAGALPFPIKELSSMSVGATLGQAALQKTLYAAGIAFVLIFAFMLVFYRLPGLIANIALLMYIYLLIAVFNGMDIVLTLPGLAALVLGVGMAVDVNIIAYERMKDEFRNGKTLLSAVIMGQKRSMPTIIDANTTSLIAGAIMLWFGSGQVRGFAIAHIISVLATFLTAVLVSRWMLLLLVRSNLIRNPWWFGAQAKEGKTK